MAHYEGRIILHCYEGDAENHDTGKDARHCPKKEFNIQRRVRSLFLRDEKLCSKCKRMLRIELGEIQEARKIHFLLLERCSGRNIKDLPNTDDPDEFDCTNCTKAFLKAAREN